MSSRLEFFTSQLSTFKSSSTSLRILKTFGPSYLPLTPRRLIILDSSFNPPTHAHLEIARQGFQHSAKYQTDTPSRPGQREIQTGEGRGRLQTDILLLLAVNNADKGVKPAGFEQRLCMMEEFARELLGGLEGEGDGGEVRVAIGVTKVPYFHEKAEVIVEYYKPELLEQVYLAGFDTLIRIFNPKYYPLGLRCALGPFFKSSRLLVTLRLEEEGLYRTVEEQRGYLRELDGGKLAEMDGEREWLGRVEVVEGRGTEGVSSTGVREVVKRGDWRGVEGMVGGRVVEWIRREGLYRE